MSHIDVANWIRDYIELYLNELVIHHNKSDLKDKELPPECDIVITVSDVGENEAEIIFTPDVYVRKVIEYDP